MSDNWPQTNVNCHINVVITDTIVIKSTIKEYFEQLCAPKFEPRWSKLIP